MSAYTAISNVDRTLVNLLWNGIKDDTQVNSIISSEDQISLSSPKAFETETSKRLSLFLYQITEFSIKQNALASPRGPNLTGPPLLYLTLHYLITPYTQNAESDHILLGKIMQTFANTPALPKSILQGNLPESGTVLKLIPDSLSIDDLNKLWSTFGTQYRLSVSYSVAPVMIGQPRLGRSALLFP